jgi:hypothetical protein
MNTTDHDYALAGPPPDALQAQEGPLRPQSVANAQTKRSLVRHNIFAPLVSGFCFLLVLSCSRESPVEPPPIAHSVSFTLNGGPYVNQSFSLVSPANPFTGATRSASVRSTTCRILGPPTSEPLMVILYFPGDTIGSYRWKIYNFQLPLVILMGFGNSLYTRITLDSIGVTRVLEYGEVGARVSGEFSGILIRGFAYDTIAVSGKFSFTRVQDTF